MTLVRSNPMMNAGRSAAYDAGDSCSCAYFQSSQGNSMMIFLGTMIVVPIFLILALAVLCGVLARIFPVVFLLCLAGAISYNLKKT